jgi:hypothetical protein
MAVLVTAIHVFLLCRSKTWVAGTSPATTEFVTVFADDSINFGAAIIVPDSRGLVPA